MPSRRYIPRYPNPSVPEPRPVLLEAVHVFVQRARTLPGVQRIALVGSLTTSKPIPKDADVLVTIAPELDLAELAHIGRGLKGKAQNINLGADIFLAEGDTYIGRTCSYRECHPRVACSGSHCVGRYLRNDLANIALAGDLVRSPPIELWPKIVCRCAVPKDVQELLLAPLEAGSSGQIGRAP